MDNKISVTVNFTATAARLDTLIEKAQLRRIVCEEGGAVRVNDRWLSTPLLESGATAYQVYRLADFGHRPEIVYSGQDFNKALAALQGDVLAPDEECP